MFFSGLLGKRSNERDSRRLERNQHSVFDVSVSSGVSRQISDFLVLKFTQKICDVTRTKIIPLT
jgi:hypothetical protein